MSEHQVKIVLDAPGRGQVFIDGVPVPHISSFTLTCNAGDRATLLHLTLCPSSLEIEAVAEVVGRD